MIAMTKAKLNLIVDAVLVVSLAGIIGIGLLINYVLIPGTQRWQVYGSDVDLYFWGLDRHEWGAIHYALGLAFAALLVLHVVLHWSMVVRIYRQLIGSRPLRWAGVILLVAATVVLVGFSALVQPEVRKGGKGLRRGRRDGPGRTRPSTTRRVRRRDRGGRGRRADKGGQGSGP